MGCWLGLREYQTVIKELDFVLYLSCKKMENNKKFWNRYKLSMYSLEKKMKGILQAIVLKNEITFSK